MVEGHQCHRVAAAHRKLLVGHAFKASSPNGRFTEGAAMIDRRPLKKIEVHGKNLFYFFERPADADAAEPVASPTPEHARSPGNTAAAAHAVLHIHFGMSGAFKTMRRTEAPEPAATTRLRLESDDLDLIAHLSAMTVGHGDDAFYEEKISKLGPDPLREDADAELLWEAVQASKKPIGLVLMDQSMVAGLGNIYRAEVLFKARVHPEQPANTIMREEFDRIWRHSVLLLQRGFLTGSILTVDDADAKKMGAPWTRRYIYNHSSCGMCAGRVRVWDMATRTVYACDTCQVLRDGDKLPKARRDAMAAATDAKEFVSHCATDGGDTVTPSKMTVAQLRAALLNVGAETPLPKNKPGLVAALDALMSGGGAEAAAAAAAAASGAPPKRLAKTPKAKAGTGKGKAAKGKAAAAAAAAAADGDETSTAISTCSDETQDAAPAARAVRTAPAVKDEDKEETESEPMVAEVDVKPGIAGMDASSIDWQNPLSMTPRASAAAARTAGPFDEDVKDEKPAGGAKAEVAAPGEATASDVATATEVAVGATVGRTPKKRRGGAAAEATPDSKRPRRRGRSSGAAAAAPMVAAADAAEVTKTGGDANSKAALAAAEDSKDKDAAGTAEVPEEVVPGTQALGDVATAAAAALEKVGAGENRAVEHVAMGEGDLAGNLLSQQAKQTAGSKA
eukprot:jgi/Ulvmu1/787/UM010_0161.1